MALQSTIHNHMSAQLCPNCGAPIQELSRLCPDCGAQNADHPALDVVPTGVDQPTPPTSSRCLLLGILSVVGCLGALILVACAGMLFFTLHSSLVSAPHRPTPLAVITVVPPTDIPVPDPKTTDGVLVYDDFSRPRHSTLTEEDGDFSRSAFENGSYIIEVKKVDTLAWALTNRSYNDVAVEVETNVAAGSAAVAAGVIFHYQDSQNFCLFSVSSDGYYALDVLKDDTWQSLIDWTQSDTINARHNTLRVEMKGSRITLKINGHLLEATQTNARVGGDAGLAVSSFDGSKVSIHFDNLLIMRNP